MGFLTSKNYGQSKVKIEPPKNKQTNKQKKKEKEKSENAGILWEKLWKKLKQSKIIKR